MGIRKVTIEVSDLELGILVVMLEQAKHQNQALGQLSQTTSAERELYRQKVDTCTAVLDQIG
jgi:hypothetical protein